MKIKILIPVYNDWQSVFKLLENINSVVSNLDHEFSVIIVNDASTENKPELSNKVENAVQQILSEGYRTGDIYTDENQTLVSCSKMGDLIIERI